MFCLSAFEQKPLCGCINLAEENSVALKLNFSSVCFSTDKYRGLNVLVRCRRLLQLIPSAVARSQFQSFSSMLSVVFPYDPEQQVARVSAVLSAPRFVTGASGWARSCETRRVRHAGATPTPGAGERCDPEWRLCPGLWISCCCRDTACRSEFHCRHFTLRSESVVTTCSDSALTFSESKCRFIGS